MTNKLLFAALILAVLGQVCWANTPVVLWHGMGNFLFIIDQNQHKIIRFFVVVERRLMLQPDIVG